MSRCAGLLIENSPLTNAMMAKLSTDQLVTERVQVLYEKEVQDYLARNLHLLGPLPVLTLVQTEYVVKFGSDVGRIDILAKDSHGGFVVIEVKRDVAGRGAVGQLQSYMGAIHEANPHAHVRGILVATALDSQAKSALRMTHSIDFYEFKTRFDFKRGEDGNANGRGVSAPTLGCDVQHPSLLDTLPVPRRATRDGHGQVHHSKGLAHTRRAVDHPQTAARDNLMDPPLGPRHVAQFAWRVGAQGAHIEWFLWRIADCRLAENRLELF